MGALGEELLSLERTYTSEQRDRGSNGIFVDEGSKREGLSMQLDKESLDLLYRRYKCQRITFAAQRRSYVPLVVCTSCKRIELNGGYLMGGAVDMRGGYIPGARQKHRWKGSE